MSGRASYITGDELQIRIDKLYSTGISKGVYVGYQCLKDLYSIKPGSTTYLIGSPFSGKTQFLLQILVNLSVMYDWKHVIFTPESGLPEEIFAEIASIYTGKAFYNHYISRMSELEKYNALNWFSEHLRALYFSSSLIRLM